MTECVGLATAASRAVRPWKDLRSRRRFGAPSPSDTRSWPFHARAAAAWRARASSTRLFGRMRSPQLAAWSATTSSGFGVDSRRAGGDGGGAAASVAMVTRAP